MGQYFTAEAIKPSLAGLLNLYKQRRLVERLCFLPQIIQKFFLFGNFYEEVFLDLFFFHLKAGIFFLT